MKPKKHSTAGLMMAAIKRVFDLYSQAGRGDRCAEHLFPLREPGTVRCCHLVANTTSKHGLASQAQASRSLFQGSSEWQGFSLGL